MRNKQLHNDTGLPYISTCIVNQLKKLHEKLEKTEAVLHFNIGNKTSKQRIKLRLPQDIFLDL